MKSVIVSAPGRACLFGEHMDWCGYSVLPMAIEMRSFVKVRRNNSRRVEVFSYPPFSTYDNFSLDGPIEIDRNSDFKYVRGVFRALRKKAIDYDLNGLNITFLRADDLRYLDKKLADLPVKKGLSSSAAISVAISAGADIISRKFNSLSDIENYLSDPKTLTFYADVAYTGERKEANINCGQMDQYASAYGGIVYIDCSKEPAEVKPLKPNLELPFVIGDTKQTKNTQEILEWLGKRYVEKEEDFLEGMLGIVDVVKRARAELTKESPSREKIGELMNENQFYLSRYLKVSGDCPKSPSKLDELIEASLKAGALGAKLSGSGGGGCMIALCKPGEELKVAEAIRYVNGEAYTTKVAEKGVSLEYIEW
jgi:galactokinase